MEPDPDREGKWRITRGEAKDRTIWKDLLVTKKRSCLKSSFVLGTLPHICDRYLGDPAAMFQPGAVPPLVLFRVGTARGTRPSALGLPIGWDSKTGLLWSILW